MKDLRAPANSTLDAEIVHLDSVIAQRFKAERHPETSVDGDNRWDYDPFEEGE